MISDVNSFLFGELAPHGSVREVLIVNVDIVSRWILPYVLKPKMDKPPEMSPWVCWNI